MATTTKTTERCPHFAEAATTYYAAIGLAGLGTGNADVGDALPKYDQIWTEIKQ